MAMTKAQRRQYKKALARTRQKGRKQAEQKRSNQPTAANTLPLGNDKPTP